MTERETEIRAWVKGRENMPWAGTDPAADLLQLLDDARRERDEIKKSGEVWRNLYHQADGEVIDLKAKVARLEAALRECMSEFGQIGHWTMEKLAREALEDNAALSSETGEKS